MRKYVILLPGRSSKNSTISVYHVLVPMITSSYGDTNLSWQVNGADITSRDAWESSIVSEPLYLFGYQGITHRHSVLGDNFKAAWQRPALFIP